MAVEAYLLFDGNCREAVEFYADVFKTGKPQIQTFGEAPANPDFPVAEDAKDRVMYAELSILGSRVMFSDTFPGSPLTVGNNVTVAAISNDEDFIRNAFNALKEGGKVHMELQETFWSKCYGNLKDKFGVEWQLSHEGNN
nr:VOC family protein [Lysinibacillus timonensis]